MLSLLWPQYLGLRSIPLSVCKRCDIGTIPGIPFQLGIFLPWVDCVTSAANANYNFATLLLQSPEQKLWWNQSFNLSVLDVWQGSISILSTWSPPTSLMVELFNLCWWSMAGLAPSTSSTRSSLCSRSQPGTAWMRVTWCLRSFAHLSQAMVSQRHHTRKVSDEKALLELQGFWSNTSAIPGPPGHCGLWLQVLGSALTPTWLRLWGWLWKSRR